MALQLFRHPLLVLAALYWVGAPVQCFPSPEKLFSRTDSVFSHSPKTRTQAEWEEYFRPSHRSFAVSRDGFSGDFSTLGELRAMFQAPQTRSSLTSDGIGRSRRSLSEAHRGSANIMGPKLPSKESVCMLRAAVEVLAKCKQAQFFPGTVASRRLTFQPEAAPTDATLYLLNIATCESYDVTSVISRETWSLVAPPSGGPWYLMVVMDDNDGYCTSLIN